ncbi:MAG: LysM domain, partial [Paenibacillus sp.]|nr:LysM domain [Paenibacillus sp.]
MTFSYVVQKEDTLFRIARRLGVNRTALYCMNPQLSELNYIYPGQVLQIPS